jgi:hypothetical protein
MPNGQWCFRPHNLLPVVDGATFDPFAAERPPSSRYPAPLTAEPDYYRYFLDLSIETA